MSRLHRAALLLAVLCALASACSNDPHPKPLAEKRADGTPWRVRYGAMTEDTRSLDPQVAYDQMSHIVLETVCDSLLQYSYFKIDPYELEPCLLDAMPRRVDHADGSVTYECRLKQGIRYMDDPCFPGGKGRELTTADVDYTWKRVCDFKIECPVLSTLQDFVVGMKEAYEAGKQRGSFDYAQPMKGLEVVDRYAFKIHLNQPYPQIQYWMAMQFFSPSAREAVEYYDGQQHPDGTNGKTVQREYFKWHPVTTGPFKIVEYRRGQMFQFIRNENYRSTTFPTGGWPAEREAEFRPLAGAQLPLVDEAQITIFREQLPAWLLTTQGYLDGGTVNKDAFNTAITPTHELTPEYKRKGMSLNRRVDLSTFWIAINMQDPVLGNSADPAVNERHRKLRQALSASFDAQTWIDIFYSGVSEVAQQMTPVGVFGHQKDFKHPYGYNLELARRLIEEAGYKDGLDPKTNQPLELALDATGGGSWERQSVEFEQRSLEQLGIRIKVNENTFPRQQEKLDQGNFQLASAGWGADYPDPENFMFLLYGKNFPPAGQNTCRFNHPEFNQLFEKMATMESGPDRLELVYKMNSIVAEESPLIFNFHRAFYTMVQPWTPKPVNNEMLEVGLKYARTDPVLRDQKRREWNEKPLWPIALLAAGFVGLVVYGVRWNRRQNV